MSYKNKICGIYKISFKSCNKVYIGLTNNFKSRKNEHIRGLKNNKHFNTHLQRAFLKYGEENFQIELIEECDELLLNEKEKKYIIEFDSFNNGYNLTTGGERFLFSEDVKKKISEKHKGKIVKESTKQKLREINLGKKMTIETKEKIKFANSNRILTEEQIKKMSDSASYKRSNDTKNKISKSRIGFCISEQAKLKLAVCNLKKKRPNSIIIIKNGKIYIDDFEYIKGKKTPPEQEAFEKQKLENIKNGRIKFSQKMKGHKVSDDTKLKISKGNSGKIRTKEQNKNNSERQKGKKQSEGFKQKIRDFYKRKREQKWVESQKF